MRMHIELDDTLVAQVDDVAGARGRSAFIRGAIEQALARTQQRRLLRDAAGGLAGEHEWDADPAAWVREQRRNDARRTG